MTRRILDRATVLRQLAVVGDKLATPGVAGEQRLALLRRQAHLGDLRDAIAQQRRRGSL